MIYHLSQPLEPLAVSLRKKVKIEFQDQKGVKYSLSVEGALSREKVMKMMDMMELIDGAPDPFEHIAPDTQTSFGKVLNIIEASFTGRDFASADLAREYEEKYNEPIPLSTVATYLSRLVDRGLLKRQKFSNSWIYRRAYLAASIPK